MSGFARERKGTGPRQGREEALGFRGIEEQCRKIGTREGNVTSGDVDRGIFAEARHTGFDPRLRASPYYVERHEGRAVTPASVIRLVRAHIRPPWLTRRRNTAGESKGDVEVIDARRRHAAIIIILRISVAG